MLLTHCTTHCVPERGIKEKILSENPVHNKIKETPSIDTYIKELCIEWKDSNIGL